MIERVIETELRALKLERETLSYITNKTGEEYARYRAVSDRVYKLEKVLEILKK